ncbi:MAG: bacteriophage Gp15 family protein [Eggerthellaceae bacterium]|jgi:hypothetical protein|nr:bacteriophage Gp15 family protein [Eggerthellaceae bacterium]
MGRHVRVIDDWENAMLIDELAHDKMFSNDEKTSIVMAMVFPDPKAFMRAFGDDAGAAFTCVMNDAFCMDISGCSERAEHVIDWEQDAARIRATMRMAYGLGDEYTTLPYMEVCELIGMSPHETPMGQALYYRTAERPEETDWNRKEVESFDECKEYYALETDDVQSSNDRSMDELAQIKEQLKWQE